MHTFEELIEVTAKLRAPEGCPWDREQTHESLKKHLKEECQEVLDAIDSQDMENLCEELGDLLFQVMIHSQIAAERGAFTVDDVVQGICEKMVRRHPHVFGDRKVNSPEEALALWQEIKKREKSEKP